MIATLIFLMIDYSKIIEDFSVKRFFSILNFQYFICNNSRIKIIKMCFNYKDKEFYYFFESFTFDLLNIIQGLLSRPFSDEKILKYHYTFKGRILREVFIEALISSIRMFQKRLTNSKHWVRVVPTARAASVSWIRKPEFFSTHLQI